MSIRVGRRAEVFIALTLLGACDQSVQSDVPALGVARGAIVGSDGGTGVSSVPHAIEAHDNVDRKADGHVAETDDVVGVESTEQRRERRFGQRAQLLARASAAAVVQVQSISRRLIHLEQDGATFDIPAETAVVTVESSVQGDLPAGELTLSYVPHDHAPQLCEGCRFLILLQEEIEPGVWKPYAGGEFSDHAALRLNGQRLAFSGDSLDDLTATARTIRQLVEE